MKNTLIFLLLIGFILSACDSKSEEITFPIELGPSCAEANELLDFNGLYRDKRGTCGNYYCWDFIRFYEDCSYKSALSRYEIPSFGFMDTNEDTTVGAYSIDGTTLTMIEEHGQYYGEIIEDDLKLRLFMPTSKKVISRPYTLIDVEADQ